MMRKMTKTFIESFFTLSGDGLFLSPGLRYGEWDIWVTEEVSVKFVLSK